MNATDRIELIRLDPDNLHRDLDSPTMRALLEKGYRPGTWWALQLDRDGDPVPHLAMIPPAPAGDDPVAKAIEEFAEVLPQVIVSTVDPVVGKVKWAARLVVGLLTVNVLATFALIVVELVR